MPPRRIGGDLAAASGEGNPRTRGGCAVGRRLRRVVHTMRDGAGRRKKLPSATRAIHTPLGSGEDVSGEAVGQRSSPGTTWEAGWGKVGGRFVAGAGGGPAQTTWIGTREGTDLGSAE